MKTKHFFLLLAGILLTACSEGDDGESSFSMEVKDGGDYSSTGDVADSNGPGSGSPRDNSMAGVVTAGEWNDLDHWPFWSKLMHSESFAEKSNYWQCYTNHRVAVQVTDTKGTLLAGIPVQLVRMNDGKQSVVWEAVTDNQGQAECWLSPWQKSETVSTDNLWMNVGGQLMEQQPVVSGWDEQSQPTVNRYAIAAATAVTRSADIAFVVDATGSMGDEIDFLKSDLLDIVNKVEARHADQTLRTAALFYRDEDDEYLTRHSDFSTSAKTTADFVEQQRADGGGDYPEAVHTALERMLQDLSWNTAARTRLAFLILDAPAHHTEDIIHSLQRSVTLCAQLGIRLIPVAASGVDKNTEFMLRFFAVATGGTYVFLTNDSGVGNHHIEASVGDYEVELLNELIIRLIDHYTK